MNDKQRNKTRKLGIATAAWVSTMALATFGPVFIWQIESSWTTLSILLNFIVGMYMICAHLSWFNEQDELERKIQVESMGFTLGATVVAGMSYSLMSQKALIPGKAEISVLIIFTAITYMVALFISRKRYS